jgi:tetratricopeptide (TPR) repeat protein
MSRIALGVLCALLVAGGHTDAVAERGPGGAVFAQAPIPPMPEEPVDAQSAERLARSLADAGELDAAADAYDRALRLRERESGPEAPETLALLDAYTDVLFQSRRFAEAEALARRAFEVRDRIPPPDASSTWPSLARIAAALRHQGRLDEAESVQRELIARVDAALGPDSSTALATRVGLSGILTAQQRFEDAISLLEQTLATADHALGPDHPETIFAANTLGLLLQDLDRSSEADPLLRRVLAYRERARGERHPETLTALHFLAFNERLLGNFASAEALYLRALRGWEEVAGRNAVPTLRTVNNYGRLLVEMGRLEEAGDQYRRAYAGLSAALGADARITLVVLSNLAQLAERQGAIGLAENRTRDALAARERAFGSDDPDTLTSLHSLGGILAEQGRYGEAEVAYLRALEGRERVIGPMHRETLATVNDLANLYERQRRYGEAQELYARALEGSERVLGPEHPDTLTTVHNFAQLRKEQGRLDASSALYERALAGRERVLGPDHSLTLATVGNLASLRAREERFEEAEALYLRALRGHREDLGVAHPRTLTTANNLALLYMDRGRLAEAEALLEEILTLSHRTLERRPDEEVAVRANLAVVLWRLDRPDEALRQLRTVDDRLARWLGRELRTTPTEAERRKVLEAVGVYSNAAFSFALRYPTDETSAFAFDLMLRWKKRVAQDDAVLNNIARESRDPALLPAIEAVRSGRMALSAAVADGGRSQEDRDRLAEQLDAAEAALRGLSERFARYEEVSSATTDEVRRALAPDEALVELRVYRPVDLDGAETAPTRLLAGVLRADGGPTLVDLGEFAILHDLQRGKVAAAGPDGQRDALLTLSRTLHDRLVARLEPHLDGVERLYLAPDGPLHALPFAALADDSGRLLIERFGLRILQTGRDLVVRDRPATARGLVAIGGVDYGPLPDAARTEAALLGASDPPA